MLRRISEYQKDCCAHLLYSRTLILTVRLLCKLMHLIVVRYWSCSQPAEGSEHPACCLLIQHTYFYLERSTIPLWRKACLAIRLAVQEFKLYLLGLFLLEISHAFTVQTDHHFLKWLI